MKRLFSFIATIFLLVGTVMTIQTRDTRASVAFDMELEPSGDEEYSPTSFIISTNEDSIGMQQITKTKKY